MYTQHLFTRRCTGNRRILYEVDETSLEPSKIASYLYGINLIAREEGTSGSIAYYLYNGHGDVTGLVDVDGVLIGSFDYEAFGDILEETGRWITEDPYKGSIDDPLSLNLYVFVRNSPLVYVDPSGHDALSVAIEFSLAAAIVDEPCFIIGDVIGLVVVGGALVIHTGVWLWDLIFEPSSDETGTIIVDPLPESVPSDIPPFSLESPDPSENFLIFQRLTPQSVTYLPNPIKLVN